MNLTTSEFLLNSSREYSIYVCENRAIPRVTDGLKHVQRMILWLLRNRSEKIRTVALGGLLAFQKIYVHGDVSATEAIGMLAAPWKNNIPLVTGLGHFGSRIIPDAIGAPRYTDVQRSNAAEQLLYHDLDIVPLEDNYDGSTKQPTHFLPIIPIILLNGVSGIAVGWSTNILPRDLKTLIEATKLAIEGKEIQLMPPSYSNYNCVISGIGQNRWEITGKLKVTGDTVHITELPPGMDVETFRKRLIDMENSDQIRSFVNKSADSIDITIRLKRNVGLDLTNETEMSETSAIEFFKLRERVTERIVVIDWNGESIRTYDSAENLVKDFVQWRLGWYKKRFEYLLTRDNRELQYWLALQIMFVCNFPQMLPFENKNSMQNKVCELVGEISLDEEQIDRIMSQPTYRWTTEFKEEIIKKIVDLNEAIEDHKAILGSPEKLKKVYIDELECIKLRGR